MPRAIAARTAPGLVLLQGTVVRGTCCPWRLHDPPASPRVLGKENQTRPHGEESLSRLAPCSRLPTLGSWGWLLISAAPNLPRCCAGWGPAALPPWARRPWHREGQMRPCWSPEHASPQHGRDGAVWECMAEGCPAPRDVCPHGSSTSLPQNAAPSPSAPGQSCPAAVSPCGCSPEVAPRGAGPWRVWGCSVTPALLLAPGLPRAQCWWQCLAQREAPVLCLSQGLLFPLCRRKG